MKVIKVDYDYESREDSVVRFVGLGDIHRGNPWLQEKPFYKMLEWIEENPCYVILMGDYGEAINAKDPRHDYNAIDWKYATPDKQYRQTLMDLEPIKDKIVCMLDGNHDYNYWRRHNHNYVDWIATDLGVPYVGVSGYVLFRFRRKSGKARSAQTLKIYAHHGWSGGRTDAYKVKVIHDLKNIFNDPHLFLMGHCHRLGEVFPTTYLYVSNRGYIREYTQKYFYTGSYLKGYAEGVGSYVEARAYSPTQIGSPIIEVKPNRTDGGRATNVPPFNIRDTDLGWMGT